MKHVQKALSIKLLFVCLHFVYVILASCTVSESLLDMSEYFVIMSECF